MLHGTYNLNASKLFYPTNIHTIHFRFSMLFLFATFFSLQSVFISAHSKCNHKIPILFFGFLNKKRIHKERNATQKYSRKSHIKRSQVDECGVFNTKRVIERRKRRMEKIGIRRKKHFYIYQSMQKGLFDCNLWQLYRFKSFWIVDFFFFFFWKLQKEYHILVFLYERVLKSSLLLFFFRLFPRLFTSLFSAWKSKFRNYWSICVWMKSATRLAWVSYLWNIRLRIWSFI